MKYAKWSLPTQFHIVKAQNISYLLSKLHTQSSSVATTYLHSHSIVTTEFNVFLILFFEYCNHNHLTKQHGYWNVQTWLNGTLSNTYEKTMHKKTILFYLQANNQRAKYTCFIVRQKSEKKCNFMDSHPLLCLSKTISSTSTLVTEEPLRFFRLGLCTLETSQTQWWIAAFASLSQDLNHQLEFLHRKSKWQEICGLVKNTKAVWWCSFFTSPLHAADCLSCGCLIWQNIAHCLECQPNFSWGPQPLQALLLDRFKEEQQRPVVFFDMHLLQCHVSDDVRRKLRKFRLYLSFHNGLIHERSLQLWAMVATQQHHRGRQRICICLEGRGCHCCHNQNL